ncbi:MAG TPA: hypothetical protein VFS92_10240, partial [Planctomycetota bacterium]|nr:hypothetical protein [Planctomycetota bacterium]
MRAAVGVMFALLLALSSRSQEVPEPMRWEGRTAAEWLVELRIGEVPARKRAAYAIWKLGPDAVADPAALRTVGAALTDGDDYVADLAGRILVRAGPAAKEAADEAVAALQDLRAG